MNWTRLGRTPDHPAGVARYLIRGDHLYVFCDGTRNRQEWRWNVMTLTVRVFGKERASKVDYEQADTVGGELCLALDLTRFTHMTIAGLSRGGAIAIILARLIGHMVPHVTVRAFAGKRAGNRRLMERVSNSNVWQRGDIVPWLPLRYSPYSQSIRWGPLTWPWKAHLWAAHLVAYWRHELTEE